MPKKYLSEKKTKSQNVSMSPALKDWLNRYTNKMKSKFPDNPNYKSVSSFICSVLDKVLTIFEHGKTLDDFNRLIDSEMKEYYDRYSGNVFIPFLEPAVVMNTYLDVDFLINTPLFLKLPEF
ncbi:MAG: hypothetical protein ACTSR8_07030 [Promethearchaeota archaeon]